MALLAPPSHALLVTLKAAGLASQRALADLSKLAALLDQLAGTASRRGLYDRLEEWEVPINTLIRAELHLHGFVNGGRDASGERLPQPPDAAFWFSVYKLTGNVTNSPELRTTSARHHATAWERNEALRLEINYLMEQLTRTTK